MIRTVAAEGGMESDAVDESISWLDDSAAGGFMDHLIEELDVQVRTPMLTPMPHVDDRHAC